MQGKHGGRKAVNASRGNYQRQVLAKNTAGLWTRHSGTRLLGIMAQRHKLFGPFEPAVWDTRPIQSGARNGTVQSGKVLRAGVRLTVGMEQPFRDAIDYLIALRRIGLGLVALDEEEAGQSQPLHWPLAGD